MADQPDYLTSLPDVPMIVILRDFDFKELTIFSMASKAMRDFSFLARKINVQAYKVKQDSRRYLYASLGRYLEVRRNRCGMGSMTGLSTLVLDRVAARTPVVNRWISDASFLGVQDLKLLLFSQDYVDLEIPPSCWGRLNSLDLSLCGGSIRLTTEQPSFLVTLKLKRVLISTNGTTLVEFLSRCQSVRCLFLREISGVTSLSIGDGMRCLDFFKFTNLISNHLIKLNISSDTVRVIFINWMKKYMPGGLVELRINAPRLEFLGVRGVIPVVHALSFSNVTQIFLDLGREWRNENLRVSDNLNYLISYISRNTHHLLIKGKFIQVLHERSDMVHLGFLSHIPTISVYVTTLAEMDALMALLQFSRRSLFRCMVPRDLRIFYTPVMVNAAGFSALDREIAQVRLELTRTTVVFEPLHASSILVTRPRPL